MVYTNTFSGRRSKAFDWNEPLCAHDASTQDLDESLSAPIHKYIVHAHGSETNKWPIDEYIVTTSLKYEGLAWLHYKSSI